MGDHGKINPKHRRDPSKIVTFYNWRLILRKEVIYFSILRRCRSLCANFHAW